MPRREGETLGYLVESYLPALIARIRDCDQRFDAIGAWQRQEDQSDD